MGPPVGMEPASTGRWSLAPSMTVVPSMVASPERLK